MYVVLDHIALVVSNFEPALKLAQTQGWHIGENQVFLGEGTEEIYLGEPSATRILLIKPIATGPYQHALDTRGEGFHHFGLVCENAKSFTDDLIGSGWNLHPHSIHFWEDHKTLWAVHSGVPLLEISPTMLYPDTGFTCSCPFPETRLLEPLPDTISNGKCAIFFGGLDFWDAFFSI